MANNNTGSLSVKTGIAQAPNILPKKKIQAVELVKSQDHGQDLYTPPIIGEIRPVKVFMADHFLEQPKQGNLDLQVEALIEKISLASPKQVEQELSKELLALGLTNDSNPVQVQTLAKLLRKLDKLEQEQPTEYDWLRPIRQQLRKTLITTTLAKQDNPIATKSAEAGAVKTESYRQAYMKRGLSATSSTEVEDGESLELQTIADTMVALAAQNQGSITYEQINLARQTIEGRSAEAIVSLLQMLTTTNTDLMSAGIAGSIIATELANRYIAGTLTEQDYLTVLNGIAVQTSPVAGDHLYHIIDELLDAKLDSELKTNTIVYLLNFVADSKVTELLARLIAFRQEDTELKTILGRTFSSKAFTQLVKWITILAETDDLLAIIDVNSIVRAFSEFAALPQLGGLYIAAIKKLMVSPGLVQPPELTAELAKLAKMPLVDVFGKTELSDFLAGYLPVASTTSIPVTTSVPVTTTVPTTTTSVPATTTSVPVTTTTIPLPEEITVATTTISSTTTDPATSTVLATTSVPVTTTVPVTTSIPESSVITTTTSVPVTTTTVEPVILNEKMAKLGIEAAWTDNPSYIQFYESLAAFLADKQKPLGNDAVGGRIYDLNITKGLSLKDAYTQSFVEQNIGAGYQNGYYYQGLPLWAELPESAKINAVYAKSVSDLSLGGIYTQLQTVAQKGQQLTSALVSLGITGFYLKELDPLYYELAQRTIDYCSANPKLDYSGIDFNRLYKTIEKAIVGLEQNAKATKIDKLVAQILNTNDDDSKLNILKISDFKHTINNDISFDARYYDMADTLLTKLQSPLEFTNSFYLSANYLDLPADFIGLLQSTIEDRAKNVNLLNFEVGIASKQSHQLLVDVVNQLLCPTF